MTVDFGEEFSKLKIEYLSALDDDIAKMREIDSTESFKSENIKELFRIIHSIKGGSGAYDFHTVAKICHQFETFIEDSLSPDCQNTKHRETATRYIDMLEESVEIYQSKDESKLVKFDDLLFDISTDKNETISTFKGRVLVAEQTSMLRNILKSGLEKNGYQCVITSDGLNAFNLLVKEKFDVLISSMNLDNLDGISLITAVKSTDNHNSNINTIVVSASTNIENRFPNSYKPGHIVSKSANLLEDITTILSKVTDQEMEVNELDNSRGPKRILYVEDDPRMQKLFELSMKKVPGVEICIASNKDEAIKNCNEFKPDVLLLDNFLKESTGQEVFLELIDRKIPSIFLTASEGSIDAKSLQTFPEFLGIITKPFRPAAIYGQICRFYTSK